MVVKVPGYQRDVAVTTLTNTLAIVQALKHRYQSSGRLDELSTYNYNVDLSMIRRERPQIWISPAIQLSYNTVQASHSSRNLNKNFKFDSKNCNTNDRVSD